jgi:hypothetical protein
MLALNDPDILGEGDKVKIRNAWKAISDKYTVISHTYHTSILTDY